MACFPIPVIPFPVLPAGFSLDAPALPPLPAISEICCVVLPFTVPAPPLPLPPFVVNFAFVAALTAAITVAQNYLDAIPLTCPKE